MPDRSNGAHTRACIGGEIDSTCPCEQSSVYWRDADIVRCPECGAERPVEDEVASSVEYGGYYCEGTIERHEPTMMVGVKREDR